MDLIRKFKDLFLVLGLSDSEISLLMAVIKEPNNSVFFYAKKINVPKDRVYGLVQNLIEKKLIIQDTNRKIRIGSLQSFIDKTSTKARKLNRALDELGQLQKNLPLLQLPAEDCSVECFTVEQFGERFVDLTYLKWDTVLGYGDFEFMAEKMGIQPDQNFVKRRMKRGGKCFPIVANPGEYCKEYLISRDENELRRTKAIFDKNLSDQFVTILPELNIVTIYKGDQGIIIKNPLISSMHQDFFKHLGDLSDKQFSLKSEK